MEFDHDNVRQVVEEDRLSSLPDELIHKILYSFDMRLAVQTCVLSSRWKLLWTSMPCLNFSRWAFSCSPKFSKFVTNVLSHRNHQIEVYSVKLAFTGAANEDFALDIFSKCVNLKNLTIKHFFVNGGGVFDIIAPRLSNLTLIDSFCRKAINLSAPQLENLTLIKCVINYLSAPVRLSSLYYRCRDPIQLPKDRFHSLDKVYICVYNRYSDYSEEDARKTINMLQALHSAKYLTLNGFIVECISSFSDLLSQHPSPFSNLICLTIHPSERKNAYKVKMCSEARNFFLENSPDTILELPEEPPMKAMKQKEARVKKKAKQVAEIEAHIN